MFSIAATLKMFGGRLEKIIDENKGSLEFSITQINDFLVKEKIPFKIALRKDGNLNTGYTTKIVITKRIA